MQRTINLQNVKSAAALGVAGLKAVRALRQLKPAVLVTVGGYASLPAVVAAVLLRIPIIATEQNSVPGAANRFASRWAKACAISFASTDLPNAVHTGNPLLGEILQVDRTTDAAAAKARLGIHPDRHLVAAFGGSLGARRINEAVIGATRNLADRSDLAIRHVVGDRDWPLFGDHQVSGTLQYQTVRYEHAMHDIYAAADFVVSRAGATSVAEIAETGTPAILVPLPGAPGDHQTLNARSLTDNGAGVLVKDSDLDAAKLTGLIEELISDPTRRAEISTKATAHAKPDAARHIADLVEVHARER